MNRIPSFALAILVATLASSTSCTDVGRCELGTEGCFCDQQTCGSRLECDDGRCVACTPGSLGCTCTSTRTCGAGLACIVTDDECVREDETVCEESCYFEWSGDGVCDDGGPASGNSACGLGSDCLDCGARRNPCVDPDYPVFCTETPGAPSDCWSQGTDCSTITYCVDDATIAGACNAGDYFDCTTQACAPSPCAGTDFPVFCPFDAACAGNPTSCCFPAGADCRTATDCHSKYFACVGRVNGAPLVLSCGATIDEVSCSYR